MRPALKGKENHIETPKDAGALQVIMAVSSAKETGHMVEHYFTPPPPPPQMPSIYHNSTTVGQDLFQTGSGSDTFRATYFIIILQIYISTTYAATLRILPILHISISTLQTREEAEKGGVKGVEGMKKHNSA